jgi:hypothetical protein
MSYPAGFRIKALLQFVCKQPYTILAAITPPLGSGPINFLAVRLAG